MGGNVPLNIIGFGSRDNQICVQPFARDFRKKHTGAIFGKIKLCLEIESDNVTHRKHKIELTFYAFLQPN